jgi:uncharacterized C2H2 Zn-finger protein
MTKNKEINNIKAEWPLYRCPKCGNSSKFIVEWYGKALQNIDHIRTKSGIKEVKKQFKCWPIKTVTLICRRCGSILKRGRVKGRQSNA